MAANDRSAPSERGATNGSKATDNRDSLAFYAAAAPDGTSVGAIVRAYQSDKRASEIEDWGRYDA